MKKSEFTSNVFYILTYTIVYTLILASIKNRSNFKKIYIIPIIVSLLVKYTLGDIDKGYQYSVLDIVYWIGLLTLSSTVVFLYEKYYNT